MSYKHQTGLATLNYYNNNCSTQLFERYNYQGYLTYHINDGNPSDF